MPRKAATVAAAEVTSEAKANEETKAVAEELAEDTTVVTDEVVEEAETEGAKELEEKISQLVVESDIRAAEDDARMEAEDRIYAEDEEDVLPSVKSMSKRQKNRRYRSDRNIIVTDISGGEIESVAKDSREAFTELAASARAGEVLQGRITAVRDSDIYGPFALIFYKDYDVIVPFEKLIPPHMIPNRDYASKSERESFMKSLLNQRIDTVVPFVVLQVDELSKKATADCLEAQRMRRRDWFWRRQGRKYRIDTGDVVMGEVVYVTRGGVGIEVGGLELYVRAEDCSYNRINVDNAYYAGQFVKVKILDVKRSTEGGSRSLAVSANLKDAEENPKKLNYNRFAVGDTLTAEVTHVDEHGIFVLLADCMEAKCYFQSGETNLPQEGDTLRVRIANMTEKDYRINCNIIRNLGKKRTAY